MQSSRWAHLTRAEGHKTLTQPAGDTAFDLRRYYTQVAKIKINALDSSVLSIIYVILNMLFCMTSSRIIDCDKVQDWSQFRAELCPHIL